MQSFKLHHVEGSRILTVFTASPYLHIFESERKINQNVFLIPTGTQSPRLVHQHHLLSYSIQNYTGFARKKGSSTINFCGTKSEP